MERETIWFLKNFNIFSGMSENEMAAMTEMVKTDTIKRREPIYFQGESSDWIYFLKKGLVRLSITSQSGKMVSTAILQPGEVFGEIVLGEPTDTSTEAVALKDTYLCKMSRNMFEDLLRSKPAIGFSIIKLLGLRIRKIESAVHDLLFLDVPGRIAKLLQTLAITDSEITPQGKRITIKLTHQEMADLIGATREMVSSVIGKMVNEKLIVQNHKQITIINETRLIKLYS